MDRLEGIIEELRACAQPQRLEGMARYGIRTDRALGVSIPEIREIARKHRRNHALAEALWATGIHEARILAGMVDDPRQVTPEQAERWVADFDSWDLCDGVCDLFRETPFAWEQAFAWCEREEEFVRRAGFVLIARLALHGRGEPDERFLAALELVRRHAGDDRNFVKKAVNWALRQIGKRNATLNQAAIDMGETIRADGTRSGRWIAANALRELRSEAVQGMLSRKASETEKRTKR